jgi:hypothetical protein
VGPTPLAFSGQNATDGTVRSREFLRVSAIGPLTGDVGAVPFRWRTGFFLREDLKKRHTAP